MASVHSSFYNLKVIQERYCMISHVKHTEFIDLIILFLFFNGGTSSALTGTKQQKELL